MNMLTVKEVAELKGCSVQYVQKLALEGKLKTEETLNDKNRKVYLIPIDALDPKLQQKYYQQHKPDSINVPPVSKSPPAPIDSYTADERAEIDFWTRLTREWQEYRNKPGVTSKAEVDERFVALCKLQYPERGISVDTLYRRWKAVKEDDLASLIDKRGKWKKGKSTIHPDVWQAFLYYYLDQSQHPIQRCYSYTKMWAQNERPELVADIPTYTTFYRHLQTDIPEPIKVLGREGQKAYDDRCAPYIKRVYDDMMSNEWWIADNHTFDVITVDADGNKHRPYLTAFMDARSGIFTGWYITYNPCSDATLIALRKGIQKYGIPDNIYVDNGREFLTFDIGGLGHRKRKPKDGQVPFEPPGVFARLGIHMTNAIVRNAKAKIIERRFLDVKNQLSRAFVTYTGGNVTEKPERLKSVLKNGGIITDEEFNGMVDAILENYMNHQAYNGAVARDKGKRKIDVYNQYLHRQRKADEESLNLMLMRTSRPQKVGRRGVRLKIGSAQLEYWSKEFVTACFGKEVYIRYDPEDLSQVRVYDMDDRYIETVQADSTAILKYGASKEEVKEAMQATRSAKRHAKELLDGLISADMDGASVLDLLIANAHENEEAYRDVKPNPKIIQIHRAQEEPLLQRASGGIDLDLMIQNAERKENEHV